MLKKILFSILFLLAGNPVCLAGPKLEVITSLYPIYDFSIQIGKDRVNVSLLLPPGVEAHTFEPKPRDIIRINKADIFIYTGKFMEPWIDDVLAGIRNKKLLVVDTSKGIELIGESSDEEKGHHHHGDKDPHIWLDLANAQKMVDSIAQAFAKQDPSNGDFYFKNAREYKTKLQELDEKFRQTFARCRHRTFICGGHFAFGYFAKRYNLNFVSPYKGFSPDSEPTPRSIAELIEKIRRLGLKYIYYEELIDPKVARAISRETGVKLLLLNGGHNITKEQLERDVSFLSIMEDNLNNLKLGLECQEK